METAKTIDETLLITGTYLVLRNKRVSDLVVSNKQIAGCKYENIIFKNVIFINCDFQGTEITNCNFFECQFVNCNFNFTKFTNCSLIACKTDSCNFCITNSLKCNYLSCTYINNSWEESSTIDAKFSKCQTDESKPTLELEFAHQLIA